MVYLAIIYHMHQPYYKNLLTNQTEFPWCRLHGSKDYLDMLRLVEQYPSVHLTINLVPSLLEQLEDYQNNTVKDHFLELSRKPVKDLSPAERVFIRENFFMINKERVIVTHPRYYELYFKRQRHQEFSDEDIRDLQVWFNLAWIDPMFRQEFPELRAMTAKARFFAEEDKRLVLDKQLDIIRQIIPSYKRAVQQKQVEVTVTPYYHPILPLLYNTNLQLEANPKSSLPHIPFSFPGDAKEQIDMAMAYFKDRFGQLPAGMWPSEESVCEHILPYLMQAGLKWIVTDEAILFRSLHKKRRDAKLLYQHHLLKREEGELYVIFRDRNLSDLIGFNYPSWEAQDAVIDFMKHLQNIAKAYEGKDVLVPIALDGENAWEYYKNDGQDFLNMLYESLAAADFVKTVTPSEYIAMKKCTSQIPRLAAGSWIYGEFSKWINNPVKNKGWEYLAIARQDMQKLIERGEKISPLAWKQMHILEGSDWYWWFGEDYPGYFDKLFRMHLANFYTLINKPVPEYCHHPVAP